MNYNNLQYFKEFSEIAEKYGIFTFILPFLLIFSIIFLLLEITNLFKKGENDIVGRKIHTVLSFGFALTALGNRDVVYWISILIPNATIWVLGIFLLILVFGLIFKGKAQIPSAFRGALALIVISSIIVIAANALSKKAEISIGFIDYSLIASFSTVIIIFAIILALIAWLGHVEEPSQIEKST
ncbi:MAG: hypothetical protein QW038_00535 [Nanopusillaceae archaeon]